MTVPTVVPWPARTIRPLTPEEFSVWAENCFEGMSMSAFLRYKPTGLINLRLWEKEKIRRIESYQHILREFSLPELMKNKQKICNDWGHEVWTMAYDRCTLLRGAMPTSVTGDNRQLLKAI